MALKRKRPTDQLEDRPVSSPKSSLEETDETDSLSAFAGYSGTTPQGKESWDLDAFAPYKPADDSPMDKTIVLNTSHEDASVHEPIDTNGSRPAIALDEPTDFSSFDDGTFGSDLLSLHATPIADLEAAENLIVKNSKGTKPPIFEKPEEIFDVSFATDWSTVGLGAPSIPVESPIIEEPAPVFDTFAAAATFEAPAHSEPGRLFVRLGKFSATYEIDKDELLIGRPDPDSETAPEITIEWDDAISRRHARIVRKGNEDYLEDLGSTNGTKLNGVGVLPHVPQLLGNGDLVHVGSQTEIVYYK
jgi:hypothetical protein